MKKELEAFMLKNYGLDRIDAITSTNPLKKKFRAGGNNRKKKKRK